MPRLNSESCDRSHTRVTDPHGIPAPDSRCIQILDVEDIEGFNAKLEAPPLFGQGDAFEILPMLTFERATPRTIPNLGRLRKELTRVVQQGYAMDDQETDLGARCVAAPILDESGKVAAAISVSGPITRISRDRIQAYALATKKAAKTISAQLGHSY